ncbi:MAG: porin [Candidatus Eiseniibacteriota bacterium]
MPLLLAATLMALAGAGLVQPRAAGAQDSSAVAKPWYEEIAVNGLASASYSYNFNQPPTHLNAYRVFDFDDNTFKVDVVEVAVQHAAVKPREGGFRVDVTMGGSVPRVSAASGLFRDPVTGEAQDFDLQQAYATYVAPLGSGLRLDAGKFVSPCGYELIEGFDGWNNNATRSFLFGFATPFTHTGVRASYAFSPKASALLMVVNGWDNATDNNTAKSVGAQLVLTPVPAFAVTLNGIVGPEQTGNDHDQRRLGDLVATLNATPRLTLALSADYGTEEGLLAPASNDAAKWSGAAGYARWQASSAFALIVRGETFDDGDGVRTGLSQTLSEFTLTPEWHVTPSFIVRADLRTDRSNRNAFPSDSGDQDSQTTVLLNALVTF